MLLTWWYSIINQPTNQHCFCVCMSGEDLFQIRGQNGLVLNSMDPLPEVSGKQEVAETANNKLETFYPVSPTIDLQKVQVYREEMNCSGELPCSCAAVTADWLEPLTLWAVCCQVSRQTIPTLTPTRYTSWKELMLTVSSGQISFDPRCSCSLLEMLWPVRTSCMG